MYATLGYFDEDELTKKTCFLWKKNLEMRGIDPRASHMLSERSTIWATPPDKKAQFLKKCILVY